MRVQEKQVHGRSTERLKPDTAAQPSNGYPVKGLGVAEEPTSSGETHPQGGMKADPSDLPPFAAPAKRGGSELFDVLVLAATGELIFPSLLHECCRADARRLLRP